MEGVFELRWSGFGVVQKYFLLPLEALYHSAIILIAVAEYNPSSQKYTHLHDM